MKQRHQTNEPKVQCQKGTRSRLLLIFLLIALPLFLGGWRGVTKQVAHSKRPQHKIQKPSNPPKQQRKNLSITKKGKQTQKVQVQGGVSIFVRSGRIVRVDVRRGVPGLRRWKGLVGSRYVTGNLDATDVTPLLWKRLDIKMKKVDGNDADVQLLRPLWWLKATKAKEGGYLDLHVPEAKIKGRGKVLKISENKADSRRLKDGENVVIGKIKHHNVPTIRLFLKKARQEKGRREAQTAMMTM